MKKLIYLKYMCVFVDVNIHLNRRTPGSDWDQFFLFIAWVQTLTSPGTETWIHILPSYRIVVYLRSTYCIYI